MDTVLIVDDSSFIVEGLIAFLKKQYRPIAAYGGAECLDILTREIPSVIILDIMMEPMDGWETLACIKENPKTRNIPVLMFSAKKISPEEAEEHRVRIDDFITKPVSPKKIIEAIEKVLSRRDANRKIIETWKSSGIGQEKIDEYLSLATSLEVDLSLCQNMKIQYDLVHPQDKNQEEFHAVITAIEGRIRHEREQIETMAREMNDLLENPSGAGTVAVPEAESPPESPVVSCARTNAPATKTSNPETLPAVPLAEELTTSLSSFSNTNPAEEPVHEVPLKDIPDRESSAIPSPAGEDVTDTGELSKEAAGEPPADVNASPGQTGTSLAGSPLVPNPPLERERSPDDSDTIPKDEDLPEYRPVVPADPDALRIPDGEPPTGAGTDVPMVWNRSREGKKSTGQQSPARPGPSGPVSDAPKSIFTRIIALVTGLFRKK